jgi:hypothetical protein
MPNPIPDLQSISDRLEKLKKIEEDARLVVEMIQKNFEESLRALADMRVKRIKFMEIYHRMQKDNHENK